jgi:hypothetical protein
MRTVVMYRNRKQCVLKSALPCIKVYTRYLKTENIKCVVTYTRDCCVHCATDCSNHFHHFEVFNFIEQEINESHKEVADDLFIEESENTTVSKIELLNLLNDC